jgi:hypothetical protein
VHKRLPAADRGNTLDAMDAAQPLVIALPPGLRPFTIACAPVKISALVPGRPAVYRSTLERCLRGSLASAAPTVELVSEGATGHGWRIDVDLQSFGPTGGGEERDEIQHRGAGFSDRRESTRSWSIAAAVNLVRVDGDAERISDSWTVSLTAESSETSQYSNLLLYIHLSEQKSTSFSHSDCLALLGQQIAQDAVRRVDSIQEHSTTAKESFQ